GDARVSLAREPSQHFDILVVDAFTGDAIPLHLLTREAMQLYQRHLAPGGIVAFHVSNNFLDLAPEVANLAASTHMSARLVQSPNHDSRGESMADWVLVTSNPAFLADHEITALSIPLSPRPALRLWTDD